MQEESAPWGVLAFVLVAFPVFFVGLWSAISIFLATFSGWRGLAARYPAAPGLRGTPLRTGWANSVGGVGYRGVLSFEETDAALVLRVMPLFPFHPDLAIPWSALQAAPGRALFAGQLQVQGGGTLQLNKQAFESLTGALARHQAAA